MNRFKLMLVSTVIATVVFLGGFGCSKGGGGSGSDHGHSHGAAESAPGGSASRNKKVDVPPNVRDNLGITFADVERRHVSNTIRVPGSFELRPKARQEYRLMLQGRVEFLVDQYETVEAGDPLYRFRSPRWAELQEDIIGAKQTVATARSNLAVARARLNETRAKFDTVQNRINTLEKAQFSRAELESKAAELKAEINSRKAERDAAKTELKNARRAFDHALQKASSAIGKSTEFLTKSVTEDGNALPRYRTLDWITVPAKKGGTVQSLEVSEGTFVKQTTLLLTTIDPARVRFRASGLQSDLSKFHRSSRARIVPPQKPGMDISNAIPAELTIGLKADPDQRTVPLLASPQEKRSWARPGVSAYLEVVTESTEGMALAIPRSAVVRDGITDVFFRRDRKDPNKVVRVEADLGVDDGRWVEVKSGLGPNDAVVMEGAYELMLATKTSGRTQKGGHFHSDGSFHTEE